jgi:oligopeptide/dipeptide ABC transporter ATP-binding protein
VSATAERFPGPAMLDIDRLTIDLEAGRGVRRVIHDVTMRVAPGEALGLVGESGSGKSMTARAIMRLLPRGARIGGTLKVHGQPVYDLRRRALTELRQHEIGVIYQDPRAHINPLRTVGDFLIEALLERPSADKAEALDRAAEQLRAVGIPDAGRRLRQYPHQLSGGLLQRVMIASVLLAQPRLILADEPTTALDLTTQQEVVAILDERRREDQLALVFITHDLDLAIAVTDRIAVMYAGVVVETVPSAEVHRAARHPYTRALMQSRPRIDAVQRLQTIPGRPVSAYEVGPGCVFADRCPLADDRARSERPATRELGGHTVACHKAEIALGIAVEQVEQGSRA